MKVAPFYSDSGIAHHVCSRCTLGNNIETGNRKQGTGGKPLCEQCKDRIKNGTC